MVDRLDLNSFEEAYEDEGRPAYAPELLVAVWLYAYALGVTSSRRLEQRVREDLAFRYLAAGATPDFWTLNQFRRQHGRALNAFRHHRLFYTVPKAEGVSVSARVSIRSPHRSEGRSIP